MSFQNRPRVLVIDDDLGPRESLRYLLKDEYDVTMADSVAAGLKALQSHPPDVIISDIRMPGTSGTEGLRLIRELDAETSIIMLTGFGNLLTAREAIRNGANDYLAKPFDAANMLSLVRENVNRTFDRRRKAAALTDLERLNRDLKTQLASARRMAILGMASSQMVHDISNPLTIVIGYLDLLHAAMQPNAADMPESARQYLSSIDSNLHHCVEVIQTWRSLGNKAALKMEPLRIAEFAGEVADNLRGAAVNAGLNVEITPEGAAAVVRADRIQLRRALQNVIHNALQAISTHAGRVTVRCGRSGDMARIEVIDNGCGIPQENLQQICHPFFTTKKEMNGTGLGLFITKQIVEDHDGHLEIESRPGHGTRVTMLLPSI